MAKQSPLLRAFNAGVWSPLMEGRIDLDKYASSCRVMRNFLPTPQGAAVARNGTAYVVPAASNATTSALLPFQFSTIQSCILEFGVGVLRFITEDGLLTSGTTGVTFIARNNGFVQVTVKDASGLSVGQSVSLTGLPATYGLNGSPAPVTSIDGNNVLLDLAWPSTATAGAVSGSIGALYSVETPYVTESDLANIRYAQKNDVLYLFCAGYPVYKLERYGATDWRMTKVAFIDGPWLDTNYDNNRVQPSGTGGTSKVGFSFTAATDTSGAHNQTGTATWSTAQPTVMTGYQILIPPNNTYTYESTIYSQKDMEPVTWVLYGSNDNSTWTTIDSQTNFVDYEAEATDWIKIHSAASYKYYKLEVTAVYTASNIPPNIQDILVTSEDDAPITLNFDNTTNINFGAGFQAGDVDRLVRLERADGVWTAFVITGINSATSVQAKPQLMPLDVAQPTTYWRLGIYSETNGFPSCGLFFSERLWMGGVANYPDTVVGSEVGAYETMQPDDPRNGTTSDSDAINVTLESRSKILWMNSDDRGLVMGTSAGEWTLQSGQYTNYTTASAITPTSVLARSPTQRGSANVDAVRIDHQTLYVQRSGRQIRAMSYSFEIDGYTSTSLSTQASHLGQPSIVRLAYQAEPYSTVWALRSDGVLLSLTYMQDEQVSGWAVHDVSGVVESIACIPAPDSQQDTLWMVVRREVNGQTVRYIERMLRPWDFDMDEMDAAFVDACTVDTTLQQTFGGLYHLAGQTVYALVDGKYPVGPVVVGQDGTVDVGRKPAQQVVVGLPMTAELVTQRLEAGSQIGTAQGKLKRVDQIVLRLWATGSGTIGTPATLNQPDIRETPILFEAAHGVDDPESVLHSFDYPFHMQPGYDRDGSLRLARRAEDLLPLNIVAMTVWVDTEDSA